MATAEYMRGYRAGQRADANARRPRPVVKDGARKPNPRGLTAALKATGPYGRRYDKCRRACTCCGERTLHTCPYGGNGGSQVRCLKCGNWN